MRYKFFASILLVLMVFIIFKYQIPQIQYDIFKDYIAKNLCINKDKKNSCCHGKCFLEKQIKNIDENQSGNPNQNHNNNKKIQNNEVKEFLCSHIFIIKPVEIVSFLLVNREAARLQGYASIIFVPPKYLLYINDIIN